MVPLLLANENAFLLAFVILLSSASCHVAESETAPSLGSLKKHVRDRSRHRRVQMNSTTDGINKDHDAAGHEEWYLPDVKLNIKKTWLFGAGDPSEWGGGGDANISVDASRNSTSAGLPTPIDVPLFAGEYITDISAGGLHSAILTNEGRILTAGSSSAGESLGLGRDTKNGVDLGFMPVTEVYPIDHGGNSTRSLPRFTKVVASQYYTFALDDVGRVWSTGNNAYAQLCLNDTMTRDRFHQVKMPYLETSFDRDSKIADVELGQRHSLLLRDDGEVYGCGWNQYGQLGIGVKGQNVASPVEIVIDAPDERNDNADASNGTKSDGNRPINHEVITDIVAGRGSSYFLTSSGHVYATGTNYKGQLCLGHRDDRTMPTMLTNVESFLSSGTDFSFLDEGVGIESIASGQSSFYLRLSNGLLLACGENTHGQIGIGNRDEDSIDVPTPIANVTNVSAVFSGPMSFGAYFISDRNIYAVGFDGVGARENWDVPNMMACASEETTLKERVVISSGNDHTLYLATKETTFECEGGTAPSTSPSMTRSPSIILSPTSHPSVSSTPSMLATTSPSSSPTVSLTSAHSSETKVPVPPPRNVPNPGNGAGGVSWYGFGLLTLAASIVSLLWE
eukprot:CAMPEP_0181139654 /NCGR_PEP_ID=MMETSP1071-20121207/34896_1 /TAXON_ID=35127 /ORGANISM="Thalassiosira sp., Strain NH16" /LENGTH=621 /DNA_ID=CAMNT_0023226573 /DNA_START=69 /DNA_END=1934 /DNA_ORIENTATION=-